MSSQLSTLNSQLITRLSVCMIAHNEEAIIAQSLATVIDWAGEVIVLDCESSDATSDIAERLGATVHHGPNMVPEANKNLCFTYATREWIFIVDADEMVPDELKREIEELLAGTPGPNGFKVPRRNFYFGVPLAHGGNYPDRQLRLFRRGTGRYPGVGYHERLMIEGEIGNLRHPLDHHPYPTFEIWLKEFDRYTRHGALMLEKEEVAITPATIRHYMITRPLRRYVERLFLKRGIRDGVAGILAATFDLMTNVVSFGRYWERKRNSQQLKDSRTL